MNKFMYSPEGDIAYISFEDNPRFAYTMERTCLIDVDEQGYIVGIEILGFADPDNIIAGVRSE